MIFVSTLDLRLRNLSSGPEGLAIAQKTLNNFVERATRLYEQGPGEPCGSIRLGEYAKRWVRWAGLGDIDCEIHGLSKNRQMLVTRPSRNGPLKKCSEQGAKFPLKPLDKIIKYLKSPNHQGSRTHHTSYMSPAQTPSSVDPVPMFTAHAYWGWSLSIFDDQ